MHSRYVYYNPNPKHNNVGDCTIRAISKALNKTWEETYVELSLHGFKLSDMPSANYVWGDLLKKHGFKRKFVDNRHIINYTVNDFCIDNPEGTYVLAVNGHVVCVVNGLYYDSWDSGTEQPLYYWGIN